MRRKIFPFLLLLPFLLAGQLELSEEILPVPGDVYFSFIDDNPQVRLGRQGQNQQWDFSSVSSGLVYKQENYTPDPVLIFNSVDYDFFKREGAYLKLYKVIGGATYEVAVQRPHPLNSDYVVFAKYEKPLIVGYAPLSYRAEKTSRSELHLDMPGENIPALVRNRLPVTADSIRVKIETVRDFRVDAEGSLLLSYNRYDVLRQEVTSRVTTSVEIFSAGKWSAINDSVLDPTGDLLGEEDFLEYFFFSDEEAVAVAYVMVDENGTPSKLEILAPEEKSNLLEANSEEKLLVISPNPTYGDVKLEMMNLDAGQYDFEIFNVIGKRLWGEKLDITRKLNSFKFNFGFLGKGTYLWAITDNQGVRVTTKRLVIVTP